MANPKTKKTVNLNKISAAFNEAVAKHPKLCDQLIYEEEKRNGTYSYKTIRQ